MNLILHHLRKDIRAQRWLLMLWALVMIINIVINILILETGYEFADSVDKIRNFPALMLIGWVTWTILLVRLIQSEPITGSTSFWLTRPIPLRTYIPSKLLFILLLIVVPCLIPDLLDMLLLQTPSALIRTHLLSEVALQAMAGLCVIWLAHCTRSLVQFGGISGLLFLGLIIAGIIQSMSMVHAASTPKYAELMLTRMGLFFIIFFCGLLISLIVHYMIRKSRLGIGVGIATTLIAFAAVLWWPVPLSFPRIAAFIPSFLFRTGTESQKRSVVEYSPDWQRSLTLRPGPDVAEASAILTPVVTNEKTVPVITWITAKFQPKGETASELGVPGSEKKWSDLNQVDISQRIKADLPDITLTNPPQPYRGPFEIFTIDAISMDKFVNESGVLNLDLGGQMDSLVRKATLPIKDSAFARLPGELIRVHSGKEETNDLFDLGSPDKTNTPTLVVWSVSYKPTPSYPAPSTIYLLVDPQSHTGTILEIGSGLGRRVNGLMSRVNSRVNLPLTGKEPLDRMILYIYEVDHGDYFQTTLTAPNFTMTLKDH